NTHAILGGLTASKSETPLSVSGEPRGEGISLSGFSREVASPYEWANIVAGAKTLMDGATGYAVEPLSEHLPLRGRIIELSEVDTAADLKAALKSPLASQ